MKEEGFIRSSSHSLKFANFGKSEMLEEFLKEFSEATEKFIDHFWNNKFEWDSKTKKGEIKHHCFDIQNDQLNVPFKSPIKPFFKSVLSARALKCSANQSLAMIRSITKKKQKLFWRRSKRISEGKDTSKIDKQIGNFKMTKPKIPENFKAELNSICCQFQFRSKEFDGFLQLHCLGKKFKKIKLPIKLHRQSNQWQSQGKMMPSFLISKDRIDIRWKVKDPEIQPGRVLGADQGITTALTLSDGQATRTDKDGWNLSKIQHRLSNRSKGSKGFAKAQDHRENFINWSINQLNFSGIGQINLEKIFNLRHKKRSDRFRSHWTHSLIERKVKSKAQETGVLVNLQSSAFRSQRCSSCGFVSENNRKGKKFKCLHCGFKEDADFNASLNHEQSLLQLPWSSELSQLSKSQGFFWKQDGLLNVSCQEFAVPGSKSL